MKKRRRSPHRSVNRLLTGLIMSWGEDAETAFKMEGDLLDAVISHRNPVYKTMVDSIWQRYGNEIYRQLKMLWRVEIFATVETEGGETIEEGVEVIEFMKLEDLAEACQPIIDDFESLSDNMANELGENVELIAAHYRIECLGSRDKRESDFKQQAAAH